MPKKQFIKHYTMVAPYSLHYIDKNKKTEKEMENIIKEQDNEINNLKKKLVECNGSIHEISQTLDKIITTLEKK